MNREFVNESEIDKEGRKIQYEVFRSNIKGTLKPYPHIHSFVETISITEGAMTCLVGNSTPVTIEVGDVIFIPPHIVHDTIAHRSPQGVMRNLVVKFSLPYLYPMEPTAADLSGVLLTPDFAKEYFVFRRGTQEASVLFSMMEEIFNEKYENRFAFEIALRGKMMEFYCYLLRHCELRRVSAAPDTPKLDDNSCKQIYAALEYMKQHCAYTLPMEEVARACGFNYYYFSRFFRRMTGKSFNEYLLYLRLNLAQKMLLENDKPITDIAMECGFEYCSYFIRKFKEHFGVTPHDFRKRFRKNEYSLSEFLSTSTPTPVRTVAAPSMSIDEDD